MKWITVLSAGELAPGGHRVADVAGRQVAVFRVGDEYCAVEDQCTHDGGPLAGGAVRDGEIECVRHGARFCLRTGAVRLGPAFMPLTTFRVRIERGLVEVCADARAGEP